MAKPIESGIGVLSLKLGASLTGPTKRMVADLYAVAMSCNRARNSIVRAWERWREDEPDWQPGQRRDRAGNLKVSKIGKPVMEHAACSQDMEKKLYYRGQEVAPEIAAKIISALKQEVVDRLKARLPYNHVGKARFRWQGIVNYEVGRDTYRGFAVPVLNQDTIFAYDGKISRNVSKGVNAKMAAMSKGIAALRCSIFSNASGRKNKALICKVEVRQMTRGQRLVLHKIAAGEWKLRDSKLIFRGDPASPCRKDGWYFALTYEQPVKDLGLNAENVAVIAALGAEAQKPLEIRAETGFKNWGLGDAKVLETQYRRLENRRQALRGDYRVGGSGVRGHGKERFFRPVRDASRQVKNLMERFSDHLVAQVIRFCVLYNFGKIIYREPTLPLRQHDWFAKHKIPYDWTGLEAKLKHQCFVNGGIEFVVERMGMEEFKKLRASG